MSDRVAQESTGFLLFSYHSSWLPTRCGEAWQCGRSGVRKLPGLPGFAVRYLIKTLIRALPGHACAKRLAFSRVPDLFSRVNDAVAGIGADGHELRGAQDHSVDVQASTHVDQH